MSALDLENSLDFSPEYYLVQSASSPLLVITIQITVT